MSKYILFAGDFFENGSGGANDKIGMYNSVGEAKEAIKQRVEFNRKVGADGPDWANILNIETFAISGEYDIDGWRNLQKESR